MYYENIFNIIAYDAINKMKSLINVVEQYVQIIQLHI